MIRGTVQNRLQASVACRLAGEFKFAFHIGHDLVDEFADDPQVLFSFGRTCSEMGLFQESCEYFRRAVIIMSGGEYPIKDVRTAVFALGQAQMRFGEFAKSWSMWESGRLEVSWQPWPGARYWCGEGPVKELLVQAEGGYGDIFMTMRWLPLLKERFGVERLGITIFPALEGFCEWKDFGVDEVYVIGKDEIPMGEWECATSFLSLPAAFRVKHWSDIPPCGADVRFVRHMRSQKAPLRIGFCHRAEENSSPIRVKSLPFDVACSVTDALKQCGEIFSLSPEKADLYSESTFQQPPWMTYEPDRMTNFRATADYMLTMDFVLTVDSAVLHLCGLLGVPCVGLIPKASCWRWGLDRKDTAWYGPQTTVYRQPTVLEWDAADIVRAVKERLEDGK